MTSIKEHVKRALSPQESVRPVHSHFTPEALTQRVCPVCGVVMPVSREDENQ